jgi:hypothetical protein
VAADHHVGFEPEVVVVDRAFALVTVVLRGEHGAAH